MIKQHPENTFDYLFSSKEDFEKTFYFHFQSYSEVDYFFSTETITIIRIAALFNFLSFSTYYGTSFFFCLIAFIGVWKLVAVFSKAYPDISDKFYFIFYIPSLVFWSSGILKDAICLGCLGYLVYLVDRLSIKPLKLLVQIVFIAIFSYALFMIKSYIILCLIIPLLLWKIAVIYNKLSQRFTKRKVRLVLLIAIPVVLITFKVPQKIAVLIDPQDIVTYIIKNRVGFSGDDGGTSTAITIQEDDASLESILKMIPAALNTTLFRPYIWEANSAFVLVTALESLCMAGLFIYVMYAVGVKQFFKVIFSNRDVFFCLFFVCLLGTALGLNVTNFGALVRFKIQILPFLIFALILIYYKKEQRIPNKITLTGL
jgi:hypothetical protein